MTSVFLLFCLFASVSFAVPVSQWEQKGITFTNGKYCPGVRFDSPLSDQALMGLWSTGANFVTVVVTQFLPNITSNGPIAPTDKTATMAELKHVITRAQSLRLRVMLKPHIDVLHSILPKGGDWRGLIGTNFTESDWEQFFDGYERFLLPYAELAAEMRVDQFSLGCELIMVANKAHHQYWQRIATSVRGVFPAGRITYAAASGGSETNTTMWAIPEVDIIGVDAYYRVREGVNATLADRVRMWEAVFTEGLSGPMAGGEQMSMSLVQLQAKYKKPLMFTEIGYCSGACDNAPVPTDGMRGQEVAYRAMMEVASRYDWFLGFHSWNWPTDPGFFGETCMGVWGKPSYALFREAFGADAQGRKPIAMPNIAPTCNCTL